MKRGPYRLIIVLLSFCVLSILLLQAYWMRHAYEQKRVAFERDVYGALDYVIQKRSEQENMRAFKETIVVENGDTVISSSGGNHVMIYKKSELKDKIQQANNRIKRIEIHHFDSTNRTMGQAKPPVSSDVFIWKGSKSIRDIEAATSEITKNTDEITVLVNKMITEIKINASESENGGTIQTLIRKGLDAKGIFIPFEYSLQKITRKKTDTLVQSQGFKAGKKEYEADLSANKVFSTHQFLKLQFPNENQQVLAGIRSSVLLSVFLSLIILGTFYYTLRLILNQKKLSEIKNDFINNMTHELKTPIATMSLALEAIIKPQIKNDEERFKEYARILKDENSKLNAHVERVLQMALLDRGALRLNIEKFDLAGLVKAVIKSHELQISEKKATIHFSPSLPEIWVRGDRAHLQAVLNNLLDNALKYCEQNCKIELELFEKSNEIIFIIKDDGMGIEPAHQEKIFEKFFRVQGGNLHDVKGFGLGLSYVKSIVEAHEGIIEVSSEKAKGSEFIVRLNK